MKLSGKTALITGAARGIGMAFAKAYIAEGARVMIADLDGDTREAAVRMAAAIGLADIRALHAAAITTERRARIPRDTSH